jgi:hypothetical protein
MPFPDPKATLNEYLGRKATDKITGESGVVTSVSFDLYGCVVASMTPPYEKGERSFARGGWFDIQRLTLSDEPRVMNPPAFIDVSAAQHEAGPAEKPPAHATDMPPPHV